MNVLTSLGIIILAMLIMAFLQLVPGVFSLLLHYSFGRFSKPKASDLATFFILGAETFIVLIFLTIYIILANTPILLWLGNGTFVACIASGVLAALGIAIVFCYFRRGPGTELFISRKFANTFQNRAKTIKSRSDAFILGFISAVPELIFTLPLYIISAVQIMQLGPDGLTRAGLIIIFTIIAIVPLLIYHCLRSTGHTLADTLKFRTHNKQFFRFCLSILYFLIAILILTGVSL